MKAYRDFITVMAEHNSKASNTITWGGQFIVRGLKSMTEDDWRLTKLAGAVNLAIGVESGSESVRDHMKKQFSNKDLDEFVEHAYLNKINLEFLMIIGYPTETEEDFKDTLKAMEGKQSASGIYTTAEELKAYQIIKTILVMLVGKVFVG